MNYCLCKLEFTAPLHIGDSAGARSHETALPTFCADTLFSALCHMAIHQYGESGIARLVDMTKCGALRLSDAMPYREDVLYLPKPYANVKRTHESAEINKKDMKRLSYLPVELLSVFIRSLDGGTPIDPKTISNDFGIASDTTKAHIAGEGKATPYSFGVYTFGSKAKEGDRYRMIPCGLYVIVHGDGAALDYVQTLFGLLSLQGIGGKTSAGYGAFHVTWCDLPDTHALHLLLTQPAARYMTLTTSLPKEDELDHALDGATYMLKRRGGFALSHSTRSAPLKKQTQHYFAAGSVFQHRYDGDVYDVNVGGPHAVYRYAMPIFAGVEI